MHHLINGQLHLVHTIRRAVHFDHRRISGYETGRESTPFLLVAVVKRPDELNRVAVPNEQLRPFGQLKS